MDVASRSRERVADRIERLEGRYGSFPVNQTTVTVRSEGYERALERSKEGLADVYVEAKNGDGEVLLLRSDDTWTIPQTAAGAEESLEAGAKRKVRATAGVDCSIEGIHQVTILGVADDDRPDRETVYRLVVVFVAECEDVPTEDEEVAWRSEVPEQARP